MLRPGMKFFIHQGSPAWEVWALDNYTEPGARHRTQWGQATYDAKYAADTEAANRLAAAVASMVAETHRLPHSSIQSAEAVVAVPYFGTKRLSLPHILSHAIADRLELAEHSNLVTKIKQTNPTKLAPAPAVDPTQFTVDWQSRARRVIIVDDVYRSGATLESLAVVLREHGVVPVAAICATRAMKGMALN